MGQANKTPKLGLPCVKGQWIWHGRLLVRRMAELRRVGGHLEARRALAVPQFIASGSCNLGFIGITEQDYWEFLRLQDEYNGQRPEGYELVPDVRNEAVTILAVAQLVIGLALVALAPKPKPPGQQKAPQSSNRKHYRAAVVY